MAAAGIDQIALELRVLTLEMRAGFAESRSRDAELSARIGTMIDSMSDLRNEYHGHTHGHTDD